jgi:isopenicillin-N N-acyltransferase-like protein
MATPLVLDLPGEPYAAGYEHGRRAAALIAANLAVYFDRFQREAQLPPDEVRARARRYLRVIEDRDPAYAEGMRGVADGSGASLIDVAVLNARYELIYSQYSSINQAKTAHVPAGGCTAFAVTPDASADAHLWLGQNWDWFPQVRGLVMRVQQPDGLTVAAFTEAGIVGGKIGMNSAGLGLVINGLLSNRDDWTRLHTPFHVRTWRMLQAATLADAVAVVTGEERSCSANFLLAHANGRAEVVNVEAAPHATCALGPTEGLLAHANHFVDPDALQVWQPLDEETTSTYQRVARMQQLLRAGRQAGTLDASGLMAILRDHADHPDSICRHPNPGLPEEERVETVVSVLEDLTARRMYVAAGTPCENSFLEIAL